MPRNSKTFEVAWANQNTWKSWYAARYHLCSSKMCVLLTISGHKCNFPSIIKGQNKRDFEEFIVNNISGCRHQKTHSGVKSRVYRYLCKLWPSQRAWQHREERTDVVGTWSVRSNNCVNPRHITTYSAKSQTWQKAFILWPHSKSGRKHTMSMRQVKFVNISSRTLLIHDT